MKLLRIGFAFVAFLFASPVLADSNYTQGDGVTRNLVLFDFICFTTKHCTPHVPINSAGTEIFTTGAPGQVGAPASAFTDGWDITQGTKADAAYTGSGSASEIAILKGLYSAVTSPPTLGNATGGWSKKRLSALSTTVTAIKSSAAGQLGMLHCSNNGASTAFVQVFDVATAGGVTLGTTAPDLAFEVTPGLATGFTLPLVGMQFSNGIQVAATTTATGSSAPSTTLNCNAGYN